MTEEQLETHTIAAWREAKEQEGAIDSRGKKYPQHLVHVSASEQLRQIFHVSNLFSNFIYS